ncbi:hypothetical protein BCR44DRAFT_1428631 [Catenaria anguillulae PL171]|uniref:Uncharacterized protein n=1 Tax=Catenaria anguillulae PL171 TaxID=765915 RepID=A0A1Y2HY18_9FUNG|nr:hypothetical protein BCR44DRAFT_1428631 [Catenaria anguillulae PL171]
MNKRPRDAFSSRPAVARIFAALRPRQVSCTEPAMVNPVWRAKSTSTWTSYATTLPVGDEQLAALESLVAKAEVLDLPV